MWNFDPSPKFFCFNLDVNQMTSNYIFLRQFIKDSFFFIVRAVSYFLLYGLTIDLNNTVITSITSMLWPKEEPLGNEKLLPKISMDVHRMPRHKCTHIPHEVRDEADVLKYDFNSRMKNVLFNSMVCAYYVGFVPICFLHVSIAMNYTFSMRAIACGIV